MALTGEGPECYHSRPTALSRYVLVRVERLELPRLAAPEPKSGVSTNFTIPAIHQNFMQRLHETAGARVSIAPVFRHAKEK
jgi:hypothetical protein